ncbi:MAG: cyclic nucleotide-binding domain-containing protein [Hyphomicrobiales bacterium]
MLDPHKERPIDFRIFKDLNIPEVTIKAGQTIVSEGDDGTLMYMIRSGTVEVQVNGVPVEEISDGGIFGEMALLDHAARSANIVAKTEVKAVSLDEKRFVTLIAKVPHFNLLIMRSLARRIRKMNAKLAVLQLAP